MEDGLHEEESKVVLKNGHPVVEQQVLESRLTVSDGGVGCGVDPNEDATEERQLACGIFKTLSLRGSTFSDKMSEIVRRGKAGAASKAGERSLSLVKKRRSALNYGMIH